MTGKATVLSANSAPAQRRGVDLRSTRSMREGSMSKLVAAKIIPAEC